MGDPSHREGACGCNKMPPDLESACRNAERMLRYAASCPRKIDETVISGAVEAIDGLYGRPCDTQARVKFWQAYNRLAAEVKPVTAESLKCFEMDQGSWPGGPKPIARRKSKNYGGWALVSLLLLILVQIYWLVGSSMLKTITKLQSEVAVVQKEIANIQSAGSAVTPEIPVLAPLISSRQTMEDRIDASFAAITAWNEFGPGSRNHEKCRPSADAPKASIECNAHALQAAEVTLQSLSLYILPLLYGLVGAFAAVLRSFSRHIEDHTFSEEGLSRAQIQLVLGAVAGPMIGLFLGAEQTASLISQFSPFAISFVAGYSVDLLFAALDAAIRYIKTGLKDGSREKDQPAGPPKGGTQPAPLSPPPPAPLSPPPPLPPPPPPGQP